MKTKTQTHWGGKRPNAGPPRKSIKLDIEDALAKLLKQHGANFRWNTDEKTWYLSGTDQGNGWETDAYGAKNEAQAKADAIYYLIEYNEPG